MWSPQNLMHIDTYIHNLAKFKKNTLTRNRIKRSGIKTFWNFQTKKINIVS